MHYVAISTELYMTFPLERSGGKATGGWDGATAATQFEWLRKDLAAANANRDMVPWVVVHGHRSICEHAHSSCPIAP